MTFEPGPANPQPFSAGIHTVPSFDPIEVLPPKGAGWLRALRQHVQDLRSLTFPFADIQEASTARIQAEQRLKRLTDHQQQGGFHLAPDDPRVLEQQRQLDKLTADFNRLNELNETRKAALRAASHVLSAVEGWLKDGRPPGTVLQDHEVEVPKLAKGENSLLDAIERLRRRGRELKADLHRIRSAPFPSSYCKQRMRAQIEALAMQGAPDVANLIEHDRPIVWPTQRVQSQVFSADPALAFAEIEAAVPLIAWLFKDALIKRLDAEIDTEADDATALSHVEREKREAEVMGDLLATERDEAALTWAALEQKLPVEHRADISPVALLGVRLITAPRANGSPGTSPQHAFDIVGARR